MQTRQLYITPEQGKRLIAKALCKDGRLLRAATEHTLVIVAGTTNGYVAEALLGALGLGVPDRSDFFRGIFRPAGAGPAKMNPERDVVLRKGRWEKGLTIFDVEAELGQGDLILKGGNALHVSDRQVGVLIGNPTFGTLGAIYRAVMGRRAGLLLPIGLEKRVDLPIAELSAFAGGEEAQGLRLCQAPGRAYCELDALESCGVRACLLAGGGVDGYEGGMLLGLEGDAASLEAAEGLAREARIGEAL